MGLSRENERNWRAAVPPCGWWENQRLSFHPNISFRGSQELWVRTLTSARRGGGAPGAGQAA